MSLDFNSVEIGIDDMPYLTDGYYNNRKIQFSQHCDILLHDRSLDPNSLQDFYSENVGFGKDSNLPEECWHLNRLGYFKHEFYMLNPFYYIGEEYRKEHPMRRAVVKNGVLFRGIGCSEDLNNLRFDLEKSLKPETLETLPIVLFRNCDKPIGINGVCDDWKDDVTQRLHCKGDTFEFIGVFKAENKDSAKGDVYKMTKIFDRYYFDDTKILN